MAKRRSDEARIIAYFTEQTVEKAQLMAGLVKDIVARRVTPVRMVRAPKPRVGKAPVDTSAEQTQ